jgi:O-antigen/teichoic acid export membrane protein
MVGTFCNRAIIDRMMKLYLPDIRFSLPYATWAKTKELFAFGKYILLMKISDGAQYRFDNLIIAPLAGLVAVTHYSVAIRLTDYFESFVSSIFYSIGSVFARHATNNEEDELREKFLTLSRLGAVICCIFATGAIVFGWQFLRVWLGPDFRDTYYALSILAISALATLIQGPARTLLQVIYKHGFDAKTNAVEVAINLVLTVILVRAYGIVGAAIGTAIPALVVKGIVLPIYVCRRLAINLKTYYWAIGTPILISIAMALPLKWIISRSPFQGLVLVILSGMVFSAVLLALLLRCLPKSDREMLLRAIGKNNLSYIPGGWFIANAVLG